MELLKRRTLFLIMLALCLPLVLANKECSKKNSLNHPKIEKGVACKDCHDDERTKDTPPKSHDLAWKKEHGKFVQRHGFKTDGSCFICHCESTCTTCHQETKPNDHTQYWRLKSHGLAVGLDRSRCMACHNVDYCQRCHSKTKPMDHNAGFGAPTNRHCFSCHYPITSAGGEKCGVCHANALIHSSAPKQPSNSLHTPGANCRSCHAPLRHPDNGMVCTVCHTL